MVKTELKAAQAKVGKRETTRLVIVDDHALLREGLKELLNSEPNLEVCGEAAGEAEAMELVRATGPALVIVDVALEQGNGLDLIKRIKTHDPSILMIVCSMYDDSLYAERALRAGALGYVNKQAPANTTDEEDGVERIGCVRASRPSVSPIPLRSAGQAAFGETEFRGRRSVAVLRLGQIGESCTGAILEGNVFSAARRFLIETRIP